MSASAFQPTHVHWHRLCYRKPEPGHGAHPRGGGSTPGRKGKELVETRHILVAEDEAHTRLSLNILLRRAGYKVTSVSDGVKALELLMNSSDGSGDFIDLLMTDIQMPDMGGLELIRAMKARNIKTPILVFTGFGDKETLIELLREGCEDYIDKPFTESSLLERVGGALTKEDARRMERENDAKQLHSITRKLESYRSAFSASCDSIESAVSAYRRILGQPVVSERFTVEVKSLPKDHLGGDFCALRDCPWGCDFILADVAGHDMGASYHTILIKSFFDVNCRLGNSGEEFLHILNSELFKNGSNERMVCAIFGRIDIHEMRMETVSAAHPHMLRFGAGPADEARLEAPMKYGAPLGIFERPVLEMKRIKLSSGDRIFLYSDGLPDARKFDPATQGKVKLGEEGLRSLFKTHIGKPLQRTCDSVWNEVMNHCGRKASDDMILLGIEMPDAPHPQAKTEGEAQDVQRR